MLQKYTRVINSLRKDYERLSSVFKGRVGSYQLDKENRKGEWEILVPGRGNSLGKGMMLEISCFVWCVLSNGDRQEHGLCESKGREHNLYSEQGPVYELWPLKDVAGQV